MTHFLESDLSAWLRPEHLPRSLPPVHPRMPTIP